MALAKAQTYHGAADALSTLRAYATDLKDFEAWCAQNGFLALTVEPEVVGTYLAAGEDQRR